MEWIQVFTIILSMLGITAGFFLWSRRETNADIKEMRSMILKMMENNEKATRDFHGKLCTLEERYLQFKTK